MTFIYETGSSRQRPRMSSSDWDLHRSFIEALHYAGLKHNDILVELQRERDFDVHLTSLSKKMSEWKLTVNTKGKGARLETASQSQLTSDECSSSAESSEGASNTSIDSEYGCNHRLLDVEQYILTLLFKVLDNLAPIVMEFRSQYYRHTNMQRANEFWAMNSSLRRVCQPVPENCCERIRQLPKHQASVNTALWELIAHAVHVEVTRASALTEDGSRFLPPKHDFFPFGQWEELLRQCVKDTNALACELAKHATHEVNRCFSNQHDVSRAIGTIWTSLQLFFQSTPSNAPDVVCANFSQARLRKFDVVSIGEDEFLLEHEIEEFEKLSENPALEYIEMSQCSELQTEEGNSMESSCADLDNPAAIYDNAQLTTGAGHEQSSDLENIPNLAESSLPQSSESASETLPSITLGSGAVSPYAEPETVNGPETVDGLETVNGPDAGANLLQAPQQFTCTTDSTVEPEMAPALSAEPTTSDLMQDVESHLPTIDEEVRSMAIEPNFGENSSVQHVIHQTVDTNPWRDVIVDEIESHYEALINPAHTGYGPQVIPPLLTRSSLRAFKETGDRNTVFGLNNSSNSSSMKRFKGSGLMAGSYTNFTEISNTTASFDRMSIGS